jgi:hypothetical protein
VVLYFYKGTSVPVPVPVPVPHITGTRETDLFPF